MENIDIVDKNGEPTGEVKSREEVHQKGLLHRHVHVWIINSKGEILLQKRAPNKKTYPNVWAMSTEGHVPAGRSLSETVNDEISEELGVELRAKLNPSFYYPRYIDFGGGWIENGLNYVFFVRRDIPIDKIKIQESEVADVKWLYWRDYKKEIESKNSDYRAYPEEFTKLFEYLERTK